MAGTNRTINSVGYGLTNALQSLAQAPILTRRDPLTTDLAAAGTLWVNTASNSVAVCTGSSAGAAIWSGLANYPLITNSFPATKNHQVLIFSDSGVPSVSAPKGSLYLRVDGNSTSTRAYIAINNTGGWTNIVTAA